MAMRDECLWDLYDDAMDVLARHYASNDQLMATYDADQWRFYKDFLGIIAARPGTVKLSQFGQFIYDVPVCRLFARIEQFAVGVVAANAKDVYMLMDLDMFSMVDMAAAAQNKSDDCKAFDILNVNNNVPMDSGKIYIGVEDTKKLTVALHATARIAIGLLCKRVINTKEDVKCVVDYFARSVEFADKIIQIHTQVEIGRFPALDTDVKVTGDYYYMGIIALNAYRNRVSFAIGYAKSTIYKDELEEDDEDEELARAVLGAMEEEDDDDENEYEL